MARGERSEKKRMTGEQTRGRKQETGNRKEQRQKSSNELKGSCTRTGGQRTSAGSGQDGFPSAKVSPLHFPMSFLLRKASRLLPFRAVRYLFSCPRRREPIMFSFRVLCIMECMVFFDASNTFSNGQLFSLRRLNAGLALTAVNSCFAQKTSH